MYIPPAFNVSDQAQVRGFIHHHGFATVITVPEGIPWASHLPVLLDESPTGLGVLRSHMARANEQWRHFEESNREVLCIFHGPHAYISPTWYRSQAAVPTWNYASVHVYGRAQLERDPQVVRKILDDSASKYEAAMPTPWQMGFAEETVAGLMKGLVGFSIQITKIEAKFKLSQNRSSEDQQSMVENLEKRSDAESRSLATFIRETIKTTT